MYEELNQTIKVHYPEKYKVEVIRLSVLFGALAVVAIILPTIFDWPQMNDYLKFIISPGLFVMLLLQLRILLITKNPFHFLIDQDGVTLRLQLGQLKALKWDRIGEIRLTDRYANSKYRRSLAFTNLDEPYDPFPLSLQEKLLECSLEDFIEKCMSIPEFAKRMKVSTYKWRT